MFLESHPTQEDAGCRLHALACRLHRASVSRKAKRLDPLSTCTSLYPVCPSHRSMPSHLLASKRHTTEASGRPACYSAPVEAAASIRVLATRNTCTLDKEVAIRLAHGASATHGTPTAPCGTSLRPPPGPCDGGTAKLQVLASTESEAQAESLEERHRGVGELGPDGIQAKGEAALGPLACCCPSTLPRATAPPSALALATGTSQLAPPGSNPGSNPSLALGPLQGVRCGTHRGPPTKPLWLRRRSCFRRTVLGRRRDVPAPDAGAARIWGAVAPCRRLGGAS